MTPVPTRQLQVTHDDNFEEDEDDILCEGCGEDNEEHWHLLLLCEDCDSACHTFCLQPPLAYVPDGAWFCQQCERRHRGRPRGRASFLGPQHQVMDDFSKIFQRIEDVKAENQQIRA